MRLRAFGLYLKENCSAAFSLWDAPHCRGMQAHPHFLRNSRYTASSGN